MRILGTQPRRLSNTKEFFKTSVFFFESLLGPLSQKTFVDFSLNLPGNFALKGRGGFLVNFSGLCLPRNEARKPLGIIRGKLGAIFGAKKKSGNFRSATFLT